MRSSINTLYDLGVLGDLAVQLNFSVFSVVKSLSLLHVRRLAPVHPPMHKLQKCSGGHTRAICCKSVISVALRELPAVTKLSIQRHQASLPPAISAGNMRMMRKLRII